MMRWERRHLGSGCELSQPDWPWQPWVHEFQVDSRAPSPSQSSPDEVSWVDPLYLVKKLIPWYFVCNIRHHRLAYPAYQSSTFSDNVPKMEVLLNKHLAMHSAFIWGTPNSLVIGDFYRTHLGEMTLGFISTNSLTTRSFSASRVKRAQSRWTLWVQCGPPQHQAPRFVAPMHAAECTGTSTPAWQRTGRSTVMCWMACEGGSLGGLGGNDGNVLFFGCHCHKDKNQMVTRTVESVGQVCFAKRYTVTRTHRIKKLLVGLTHGYWLPVGRSCSRTCQDEPYRRLLMAIRRRCWRTKVSMEVEAVGTLVVAFLDKILVMEIKEFPVCLGALVFSLASFSIQFQSSKNGKTTRPKDGFVSFPIQLTSKCITENTP